MKRLVLNWGQDCTRQECSVTLELSLIVKFETRYQNNIIQKKTVQLYSKFNAHSLSKLGRNKSKLLFGKLLSKILLKSVPGFLAPNTSHHPRGPLLALQLCHQGPVLFRVALVWQVHSAATIYNFTCVPAEAMQCFINNDDDTSMNFLVYSGSEYSPSSVEWY